jgi:hypothetical protein
MNGQATAALIASIISTAGLLIAYFITRSMHRSLEAKWSSDAAELRSEWLKFAQQIQNSMNVLAFRFAGSILTFEELMKIEEQINCQEIWIVTGSLEGDIKASQMIQRNIKRGIVYKYILPRSTKMIGRAEALALKLGASQSVTFEYIEPGPLLTIVNIHDFIIYDPHDAAAGRRVYINIPTQAEKNYFLEIESGHAENVCAYLTDSLKEQGTH